jgi:hypothetical protein
VEKKKWNGPLGRMGPVEPLVEGKRSQETRLLSRFWPKKRREKEICFPHLSSFIFKRFLFKFKQFLNGFKN